MSTRWLATIILRVKKRLSPKRKPYTKAQLYFNGLLLHIALNIMVVRAIAVEGSLVESLLCRWVSHRDDEASALLKALAIQVYCTILGYEPVDVVTGCNNTSTLGEDIRNLRYTLVGD